MKHEKEEKDERFSRRGRPEKKEKKRTVTRTVSYNKDEMQVIIDKAKELKLRINPYIRASSLDYNPDSSPIVTRQVRNELRRIGVNLNQLTRYYNEHVKRSGGSPVARDQEKKLEELINQIHNTIKNIL